MSVFTQEKIKGIKVASTGNQNIISITIIYCYDPDVTRGRS